ncbi:MAG TPA: hypothetical protein VGH70_00410 [Bradyrhizobium sp.]
MKIEVHSSGRIAFFDSVKTTFCALEKTPKSTIYSILYDWLICARRSVAFMAQLDQIGSSFRASLIPTSLKGLT